MRQQFSGFGAESFAFFQDLARNNAKAWFDLNRDRYEEHVKGVFRSLLCELEPFLRRLNPNFQTGGKTNRILSRINRDIRFSKDKRPYRSDFYLWVFDRRRERDKSGRFYVGLSTGCVTVGFSIYATRDRGPKGALETVFQERLVAHPQVLDVLVRKIVKGGRYETYWYGREKKEWVMHPGLPGRPQDWLHLQGWVVRKVFEPQARELGTPRFARRVETIFAALYPLYAFTSIAGPRWPAEMRKRISVRK